MLKIHLSFCYLLLMSSLIGQTNVQDVFGVVTDAESGEKLFGATVYVLNTDPMMGVTTDFDGAFLLENVPVGRLDIKVSYLGYETATFPQLLLSSGKAYNLDVKLQESFNAVDEVVVLGNKVDRSMLEVHNEMATVSGMSYTLEQGSRYAGSNNDPSRLVLSFPGVRNQGDIQNGISIRGNTPTALLWNLEGMEVQSPNHFAREGALGAVNMISSNIMQSVDFYTAAFPAQYANAGSGVFDIKVRKGNPDKHEFSVSAGSLGVEASAEGPFSKKYKGSFLVSYRYSTIGILSQIGVNLGNNASPVYQDLNYKLHLPTKNLGAFSVFGLFGDSYIRPIIIKERDGAWSDEYRLGIFGVNNKVRISDKSFMNTTMMYSQSRGYFSNAMQRDRFRLNENTGEEEYRGLNMIQEDFPILEKRLQADVKIQTKVNPRHSFQTGLNVTYIDFSQAFNRQRHILNYNAKEEMLVYRGTEVDSSSADLSTVQIKAFMQHKIRLTEKLNLIAGLSFIHMNYTKFFGVEPRIGLELAYGNSHKFNTGFGMHSRLESLGYYGMESTFFTASRNSSGVTMFGEDYGSPNRLLDATKSIHFVLGNKLNLAPNLSLKVESYVQYLYQIPVVNSAFGNNDYASLNFQYPSIYNYDFRFQVDYVNAGQGLNYGVDLTLEKAFTKQYYFLVNGSYYQSKYRTPTSEEAYELKWLNTRYNGNFIFTVTAGKDFTIGKKKNNIFGLSARSIWAGNNREDFSEDLVPFVNRLRNYFRLDTRVAYTRNKEKYSWVLSLDLQNLSNRINEASNPLINSTGLLPFLNYKASF